MGAKNSKKVVKFKIRTHNVLIIDNRTGAAKLNDIPVDSRVVLPLIKRLATEYPNSNTVKNSTVSIWQYPTEKATVECFDEIENGYQDAAQFESWNNQQAELTLKQ